MVIIIISLDVEKRRSMLYLSTEEVNSCIREAVSGIKEPVQVNFRNSFEGLNI